MSTRKSEEQASQLSRGGGTLRGADEKTRAEAQAQFLAAYEVTGKVVRSARAAGVGRRTHYGWLEDSEYRERFEEAHELWVESLEEEARRRAVEGVVKPAGWYKGVAGGTVREHSDGLLQTLLKAERPDKYADRLELKGVLAGLDMSRLTDEQIDRITRGEHPLAVLSSSADQQGQPGQLPRLPASTDQDPDR
jgi:hypothetical protein